MLERYRIAKSNSGRQPPGTAPEVRVYVVRLLC